MTESTEAVSIHDTELKEESYPFGPSAGEHSA
jgi:hypothetical protein